MCFNKVTNKPCQRMNKRILLKPQTNYEYPFLQHPREEGSAGGGEGRAVRGSSGGVGDKGPWRVPFVRLGHDCVGPGAEGCMYRPWDSWDDLLMLRGGRHDTASQGAPLRESNFCGSIWVRVTIWICAACDLNSSCRLQRWRWDEERSSTCKLWFCQRTGDL